MCTLVNESVGHTFGSSPQVQVVVNSFIPDVGLSIRKADDRFGRSFTDLRRRLTNEDTEPFNCKK